MNVNLSISLVFMTLISFSFVVQAKESEVALKDIKCHVELTGGRDIIHYVFAKKSEISGLKTSLVGKKTKTYAVKGEQVIYKVNECVAENQTFNSAAAKSADIFAVR